MNIFVLAQTPFEIAKFHADRHVAKMMLETAQILSTAHVFLDGVETAKARVPLILRPTHVNHPWARWARSSSSNYAWASSILLSLAAEYGIRFKKTHQFYAQNGVAWQLQPKPLNLPVGKTTTMPQCMPKMYQRADVVEAYRRYYFCEKRHVAVWSTPREVPEWWEQMERDELIITGAKKLHIPKEGRR